MQHSGLVDKFRLCNAEENFSSEDVAWMDMSDESRHFLDWFTKYIDESNAPSQAEINMFNAACHDIPDNQKKKISSELSDVGVVTDSVFEVTHLDLYTLEENITVLSEQKEILQNIDQLLGKEIVNSINCESHADKELNSLQMELFKQSQALMKLSALSKSALNSLAQSSSKYLSLFFEDKLSHDLKRYLYSQMDLNEFLYQCNKFDGQLQLYTKRVFKEHTSFGATSISFQQRGSETELSSKRAFPLWCDQFGDLAQKLWDAHITKIALQAQLSGIIVAENNMKLLHNDFPDLYLNHFQIRMEIEMCQNENCNLNEEISQSLKGVVGDIVKDNVLFEITSVSKKLACQRIEKRKEMLSKLGKLRAFLDKRLFLSEVVWMLLHREAKIISFASEILSETIALLEEEFSKHQSVMNRMQIIEKQRQLWITSPPKSQFSLLGALQDLLECDKNESNHVSLFDLVCQRKLLTAKLETQIMEMLSVHLGLHKEGELAVLELLNTLNCGCTRKPVLYSSNLFCRLEEIQLSLRCLSDETGALRKMFSTKKLTFESPIMHSYRLLWAWFLVAPNRLEEAFRLAM